MAETRKITERDRKQILEIAAHLTPQTPEGMRVAIQTLTLALQASEERAERWKAEAMAARAMHRSNVTLGARDGTATFRKWHDARALNDIKEPKAKETER